MQENKSTVGCLEGKLHKNITYILKEIHDRRYYL